MSKVKKSKRKNRIVPILVVVLVVLLLLLVTCIGIFVKKNYKKDGQVVDQNEQGVTEFNEDIVQDDIKLDENTDQKDEQVMEQEKNNVQDETAFYEIETKYCKLYFPETWKEQIEVRYSEEAGYKAEFYGLVEGKDAQHLFDVCFNSDDGDLLGYLDNEGEIVNISIDVMELEMDKSWTQEELDQLYSMQEEMNYVMNSLSRNENYVEP